MHVGIFERTKNTIPDLCADITDVIERTTFEKVLLSSIEDKDIKQIITLIEGFNGRFPKNAKAVQLLSFLKTAIREALVTDNTYDDSDIQNIALKLVDNFKLNDNTNKKIICIDEILPFELCKKISENIANLILFEDKFSNPKIIFPFIVCKNKSIEGRIIQCSSMKYNQILVSASLQNEKELKMKII
jgi:hypothetical protein